MTIVSAKVVSIKSSPKRFEKMNSYNQNKWYWEEVSTETKRSNTVQLAIVDEAQGLITEIKNMLEEIEEILALGEVFNVDEEAWYRKLKASFESVEDKTEEELL